MWGGRGGNEGGERREGVGRGQNSPTTSTVVVAEAGSLAITLF